MSLLCLKIVSTDVLRNSPEKCPSPKRISFPIGQRLWRGTRSALLSPQRQPLPWCNGQTSQGQLFLLNTFSDLLCNQADGTQHLPTTTHLHSRQAAAPGSGQIDPEPMPLSQSLFEVFRSLPEPGCIGKLAVWLCSTGGRSQILPEMEDPE